MKLRVSLVLTVFGLTLGSAALADNRVMYFRYYDDRHQVHLDQEVTDDAITYGYDELDRNLAVVHKVPPKPTEKDLLRIEAEKRKQAEAVELAKHDALLRQLYSSPQDAERERDRQLDAIQLHINFSKSAINRLRTLRATEAQHAANYERSGQPVPKDTRDTINKYDQQIVDAENDLRAQEAAQTATRAEFDPNIRRLREMEAARLGASAGVSSSAAPATP